MAKKQIKRAEALQHIASMRGLVVTLKEQMEPLPFGLAQHVNICLHSLHLFEGEVERHYRWNEESPVTTNTRYWLFGGARDASGGMYDAMARFGALEDAIAHAKAWEDSRRGREWWHVVDTVTGELVAESETRPYGAPERKAKR